MFIESSVSIAWTPALLHQSSRAGFKTLLLSIDIKFVTFAMQSFTSEGLNNAINFVANFNWFEFRISFFELSLDHIFNIVK